MATPAELQQIRDLLNDLNLATHKAGLGNLVVTLATTPATPLAAGVVKQAAAVAHANVDNSDAGAKLNAVIDSLKAAGLMA